MAEERSYRVRELMAILNVSRETVLRRLARGELRGFKVGRDWRVSQEELDRFRQQRPRQAPDALAPINAAIAQEGECTRPSDQDTLMIEAEGRAFRPRLMSE